MALNYRGTRVAEGVDDSIKAAMASLPDKSSRGKSLAITKLEEARFWALEAISSDPEFIEE